MIEIFRTLVVGNGRGHFPYARNPSISSVRASKQLEEGRGHPLDADEI